MMKAAVVDAHGCSLHAHVVHVGSARKSRNNAGEDCTFGGRTWNAADEGRTSALLLGVFPRFISVTTFTSQMNLTAIAMCCHSGSRAIISNSTMLSSRQSDRTIRAHPWEILVPSLHSSPEKTQQESPKVMVLKMRECHNNPKTL